MAVALLMLLAAVNDASSEAKSALTCPQGRPQGLVADAQAQVYRGRGTITDHCEMPGSAKVFGRLRHRRAYVLGPAPWGTPEGVGGVSDETLAGPIVAYEQYRNMFAPHAPSRLIMVRDLRTGRLLHSAPTATPVGPVGVAAIVVKSDGAVAWIVDNGTYTERYQVHAIDENGGRLLASGSNIEPRSLALGGNELYWTEEGRPTSASLN